MTDEDKFKLYNVLSRSLRECLVPYPVWEAQVDRIESFGPLRIKKANPYIMKMKYGVEPDNIYVVPYPYEKPLYLEILKRYRHVPEDFLVSIDDIKKFTDADYDAWQKGIGFRMQGFLRNMVTEDFLSLVDENYDYGAIIHQFTGKIFMFDYSEVTDITTTAYSLGTRFFLESFYYTKKKAKNEPIPVLALKDLYEKRSMYDLFYSPHYKNSEGDIFHYPGGVGCMSERSPLSAEETSELLYYVENMFKSHAKTLTVP